MKSLRYILIVTLCLIVIIFGVLVFSPFIFQRDLNDKSADELHVMLTSSGSQSEIMEYFVNQVENANISKVTDCGHSLKDSCGENTYLATFKFGRGNIICGRSMMMYYLNFSGSGELIKQTTELVDGGCL